MGVRDLFPNIKKLVPQAIQPLNSISQLSSFPQPTSFNTTDQEKRRRPIRLALDGNLLTTKFHYQPSTASTSQDYLQEKKNDNDEESGFNPNQHVKSWYYLLRHLERNRIEAIVVFDGTARIKAKEKENRRRREERERQVRRAKAERERGTRLKTLKEVWSSVKEEERESIVERWREAIEQRERENEKRAVDTAQRGEFVDEDVAITEEGTEKGERGNRWEGFGGMRRPVGTTSYLSGEVRPLSTTIDATATNATATELTTTSSIISEIHESIKPLLTLYEAFQRDIDNPIYSKNQQLVTERERLLFESILRRPVSSPSTDEYPPSPPPPPPVPAALDSISRSTASTQVTESNLGDAAPQSTSTGEITVEEPPENSHSSIETPSPEPPLQSIFELDADQNKTWRTEEDEDEVERGAETVELEEVIQRSDRLFASHSKRSNRVPDSAYRDVRLLIESLGYPILTPSPTDPHEAEGICSTLFKNGQVDFVVSEDTDVLVYGAKLLRKFNTTNSLSIDQVQVEGGLVDQRWESNSGVDGLNQASSPHTDSPLDVNTSEERRSNETMMKSTRRWSEKELAGMSIVDPELIRIGLGLNEEEFIDWCLLCGTDFTRRITGLGPITALALIRKYHTIENIFGDTVQRNKYISKLPAEEQDFDEIEVLGEEVEGLEGSLNGTIPYDEGLMRKETDDELQERRWEAYLETVKIAREIFKKLPPLPPTSSLGSNLRPLEADAARERLQVDQETSTPTKVQDAVVDRFERKPISKDLSKLLRHWGIFGTSPDYYEASARVDLDDQPYASMEEIEWDDDFDYGYDELFDDDGEDELGVALEEEHGSLSLTGLDEGGSVNEIDELAARKWQEAYL